jgi:hypothetical protein
MKPAAATATTTVRASAKLTYKTGKDHEISLLARLRAVKIGVRAPTCATLGPWQRKPSGDLPANSAARPYRRNMPRSIAELSYPDA